MSIRDVARQAAQVVVNRDGGFTTDDVADAVAVAMLREVERRGAQTMHNNTIGSDSLLTTHEAAEKLRSTPASLARWRTTGLGPRFVKVGRRVCYRHEDLEHWVKQQTRQHTAQRKSPEAA